MKKRLAKQRDEGKEKKERRRTLSLALLTAAIRGVSRRTLPQAKDLVPSTTNECPDGEVDYGEDETELIPLGLRNITSTIEWWGRACKERKGGGFNSKNS